MQFNLYKITDIVSKWEGSVTIKDSSDNFGHARLLHNYLINENYVNFDHIGLIEISSNKFTFHVKYSKIRFEFVVR